MTDEQRNLMLEVLDGYQPHEPITGALYFLDTHLPKVLLTPALLHLKRNKLTGKKLVEFIMGECENDVVEFHARLIRALHKDKYRTLLAGRDLI